MIIIKEHTVPKHLVASIIIYTLDLDCFTNYAHCWTFAADRVAAAIAANNHHGFGEAPQPSPANGA